MPHAPRQGMTLGAGRWVSVMGLAGVLLAAIFLLVFRREPTGTIAGDYDDHVAHIGETRVVSTIGTRLWRIPSLELFRPLTSEEVDRLPADVRAHALLHRPDVQLVPTFPSDRPLVINYPHLPRCYPPGVFLASAPSALLYHFGVLSFGDANRSYLALLALAWLLALRAWTASWRDSPPSPARQLATAGVAAYAWYWALNGFYDLWAIAFASMGFAAARERRFGAAALMLGLSAFIHPRLLILTPLFVIVAFATAREWRRLGGAAQVAVAGGALLLASAYAFAIAIQGTVRLHAISHQSANVIRLGGGSLPIALAYSAFIAGLVFALWRKNERWDALFVLFAAAAFSSQRYLCPWYWLPILPWALMPSLRPSSDQKATAASPALATFARVTVTGLFFVASNIERVFYAT
jgi:hypothetical protein